MLNPPARPATAAMLLASLLASAPAAMADTPVRTVYADATLIDGTGAPALAHQDIIVEGERIVAIVPHGDPAAQEATSAMIVDLSGAYVIPGLIDTHVHMATPPAPAMAKAMLRRNLYGGVTAVRDMADDVRSVAELAREARYEEIPGPDIYYVALFAGRMFFADPRVAAASQGYKPGTAPWMQAIDRETDLAEAVTLARGTGATAIKIYADLPGDLVAAITEEAQRQGLKVWAHSAVFPSKPSEGIEAGVDTVSHVCYLAYETGTQMLDAYEDRTPVDETYLEQPEDPVMAGLFARMVDQGIILDATGSLFVLQEAARKAAPDAKPLRCTGAATTRLTRQAWKAGVPISTGTDTVSGADHAWPDVFDELFFLAEDVGMPAVEVIHSATEVGAEAIGVADEMGTVAPGKLANFVVLADDPLADIDNIRSIRMTVKRGTQYRRADYPPVTEEELSGEH
ncbi:amidohydrolase family protein [Hyphomonas jannaschiana]|uniref:amidohydrolase family protein n=1 Tax=Hyphomonas jannaschiana TaxID=86 RepID=UPI0035C6E389